MSTPDREIDAPPSLPALNRALNAREVRAGALRLRSTPLQVNVELTGLCNIDPPCVFCTGKNFGHNYAPLPLAHLAKYAGFLERCEHVNEDSFGEPLSHPSLVELAERVTKNGQVFSFVTNGLLLTRRTSERLAACGPLLGIHVSLNAATDGTFERLTGRRLGPVIGNVRCFVEAYRRRNGGAPPALILTFIVMKVNRHEVPAFLRLTAELGARALLAPLHDRPSIPLGRFGYDFRYEEEMLPYGELAEIGREATALAGELGIDCVLQWDEARDSAIRGFAEPGVAAPCLIPWRFLFLQEHTRKAFACPYHRVPFGDLDAEPVDAIWNGEAAQRLRRSLAQGEIPKFCRDHSAGCPLVMAERHRGIEGRIERRVVVGQNDYDHFVSGWHPLEFVPEPIRWTSAAADFLLRTEGRARLVLEATTWGKTPAEAWVELEGARLGAFSIDAGAWRRPTFRLPARGMPAVARGRIGTDDPWSPSQLGLGPDTRRLGVAVRGLWAE